MQEQRSGVEPLIVEISGGMEIEFPAGTNPQQAMSLAAEIDAKRHQSGEVPQSQSFASGLLDSLTDGAVGGLGDEATALEAGLLGRTPEGDWFNYDQSFDDRVDNALRAERAQEEKFDEEHPWSSTGAEIVGGVIPAAKIAKGLSFMAGKVAPTVGNTLSKLPGANTVQRGASYIPGYAKHVAGGSAIGAAGGTVQGFNEGEGGFDNRVDSAQDTAAYGAVFGAGGTVAADGIKALVGAVAKRYGNNADIAYRKVIEALRRDGFNTIDEAEDALNKLGPEGMIADLGANTRAMAQAVTSLPGQAKDIGVKAVTDRQRGMGKRLLDKAKSILGTQDNFWEQAHSIVESRKAMAQPAYDKAFTENQNVISGRLRNISKAPSMKKVLDVAMEIAEEQAATDPSIDLGTIGLRRTEKGIQLIDAPNLQTWDIVKQAMDDLIEGYRDKTTGKLHLDNAGLAINGTLRELVKELDRLAPAYKPAREIFAGHTRALQAMHTGRNFMKGDAELTDIKLSDMDPFEREFYKIGALRGVEDHVGRTRKNNNSALSFDTLGFENRARTVFGDEGFEAFSRRMDAENQMNRTYGKVTGQSDTQRIKAAQQDLTGEPAEVGTVAVETALGGAWATISRKLGGKATRVLSQVPEAERDKIGRLIFEYGGQTQRTGLQQLKVALRKAGQNEAEAADFIRQIAAAAGVSGATFHNRSRSNK